MVDITTAKQGDRLSDKAIKKLAGFYHLDPADERIPREVQAKTEGDTTIGQWFCIDCGYPPTNNMEAWTHAEKHTKRRPHRLAWRSFASGQIEAPQFRESPDRGAVTKKQDEVKRILAELASAYTPDSEIYLQARIGLGRLSYAELDALGSIVPAYTPGASG